MHVIFNILSILIVSLSTIKTQFHLYYTDSVSESDLYYHCLLYRVPDVLDEDDVRRLLYENPYQLISYCIRPLAKKKEEINGSISSEITFEQLKKRKVNTQDLLRWSAPIDLVENYQEYLDTSKFSLINESFYNCSSLWFGPLCQYTFNSKRSFSQILNLIFVAKLEIDVNAFGVTNLSCYTHLQCYRGSPPLCLDWREICDGRIDCFENGIDEMYCIELEMNECEENEYRCHNGMCIPEQFFNDNQFYPDCLDSTDEATKENYDIDDFGLLPCTAYPGFRCEESHRSHLIRNFACGDGQEMYFRLSTHIQSQEPLLQEGFCMNERSQILFDSIQLNTKHPNFSLECWLLLICAILGTSENCQVFCCDQRFLPLESKCNQSNYIILPVLPIFHDDVQFGYWMNRTINIVILDDKQLPDFVCYNKHRCPLFPSNLKINNLTCLTLETVSITRYDQLVRLFHTCLPIDVSGDETHCRHSSLFHCPGSSKCISKHRLLDGIDDCYGGADEKYEDSCNLNHTHRFHCSSENKCISPILVRDEIEHCKDGKDEIVSFKKKFSFQNLCNGYVHLLPELINGQNETDETNCEQWPCINQYTRCDGAWTCSNGADELNCNQFSKCYPNHHECVSPTTLKVMCLPVDHAGDGKIDCLGATDERDHCRSMKYSHFAAYRCWNDTKCVYGQCFGMLSCESERFSTYLTCINDSSIAAVFNNLVIDNILRGAEMHNSYHAWDYKYFSLHFSNHHSPNAKLAHLEMMYETHQSNSHIQFLPKFNDNKMSSKQISSRRAWICNRGVLIYMGVEKMQYCLCPPSYYGDQCEFQSQRVSLTLKFSKECAPSCQGIYAVAVILVDANQVIHSYEHLTYISTINCTTKYNLYFLYQSRLKNLTKNYTIHVHAYNKIDLTYHASWILPIKFLFLPVNRIAVHLFIPAYPVDSLNNCQLFCGDHGHCVRYVNNDKDFCRCHSGWSGLNCTIRENKCSCSTDSFCLGIVNNRSICLCPLNKTGPRCFLHSVCQHDTCKNGGYCVSEDDRTSMTNFTCICLTGYSGNTCEIRDSRIDVSFHNIQIPQFLLIHLIIVQQNDHPSTTTIWKKIALDEDTVIFYTLTLFNLIFVQIGNEYYLSFLQINATQQTHLELEIKPSHYCSPIYQFLDQRTAAFPLLRRVKYYHIPCKEQPQLKCFHDQEEFMCLCNNDRHANCFNFGFEKKSNCQGQTQCENGGQCIQDRSICPTSTMCICRECFYGGKCQFTTKGFSLSLDIILAYQIRRHIPISHQRNAVKVSIIIFTSMLFIDLISSTLCAMTFRSKKLRDVGCGIYLFILSILSLISTIILNLKLWLFILSQMSLITNRTILWINCISMEFILRSLLAIGDWLSACIAIERTLVVKQGVSFNKKKSKQASKWIIIMVIMLIMISLIYDPISRQLIDDEEEQRTWCVVQYSSLMRIVDSIVHSLHFIIPFVINLLSAIIIIINAARTHSNARKQKTYKQHLKEQFRHQKHLIISPIIIVILSIPRLIISFLSGCMKSNRDPWLFLFGYYISFIPSLLKIVVFILPSETYKKEFSMIIKQQKKTIRRYLHLN